MDKSDRARAAGIELASSFAPDLEPALERVGGLVEGLRLQTEMTAITVAEKKLELAALGQLFTRLAKERAAANGPTATGDWLRSQALEIAGDDEELESWLEDRITHALE